MTLLLDEMIGPGVAAALRAAGIDTVAVVERTDLRALPDDAVLAWATTQNRVLVTRNIVDYVRLSRDWQATGRPHAGVLLVSEKTFPQTRELIGALVTALLACPHQQDMPGEGGLHFLREARAAGCSATSR